MTTLNHTKSTKCDRETTRSWDSAECRSACSCGLTYPTHVCFELLGLSVGGIPAANELSMELVDFLAQQPLRGGDKPLCASKTKGG